MKRPKFLKIWLIVMLILSIIQTIDALTYLPLIRLTKSYLDLVGILAGFVEICALVLLLRWKKSGVMLLLSAVVVIFVITGIDEFKVVTNVSQIAVSMLTVLVVNIIILGILYWAIKPFWRNFK